MYMQLWYVRMYVWYICMYVCMHVCTCIHYACVGMYIHIYVFMYYYLFSVLSVTVSVIVIVNVLLQNALKLTVAVLKLVLEINNLNNFITFHILCLKSSVYIYPKWERKFYSNFQVGVVLYCMVKMALRTSHQVPVNDGDQAGHHHVRNLDICIIF